MKDRPNLKPGDFFCVTNPSGLLGKAINKVQRFEAKDGQSELSHAGIILDESGTTFEALTTYRRQNLWDAYSGDGIKIIIGRHILMTPDLFRKGFSEVRGYEGKRYPAHRLLMFLVPFLANHVSAGPAVCSEITMQFLCGAGLAGTWKGWNPDDVADMIVRNRLVKIIYHQNIESYPAAYLDAGGETVDKNFGFYGGQWP